MLIKDIKKNLFEPQSSLVAFQFIKQKDTECGILLPSDLHDINLRIGKTFLGKVIAVGPDTKSIKVDDIVLYHEYEPLNFEGTPNNEIVYFIKEDFIKGTLEGVDDPSKITIIRKTSEDSEFQMMKRDKESFEHN